MMAESGVTDARIVPGSHWRSRPIGRWALCRERPGPTIRPCPLSDAFFFQKLVVAENARVAGFGQPVRGDDPVREAPSHSYLHSVLAGPLARGLGLGPPPGMAGRFCRLAWSCRQPQLRVLPDVTWA